MQNDDDALSITSTQPDGITTVQVNAAENVQTNKPPSLNNYEKAQWFLMGWMAVLTLLVFAAYFTSRDVRVLLGGTIVAIAVGFVYAYYFKRK
jgi:hypothetical protein